MERATWPAERWCALWERAATDAGRKLIIRALVETEAAWRWTPAVSESSNGYRHREGRPRSQSSGRILDIASEASGLTVRELRATLGRHAHPAVREAARAERASGATVAAIARELGVSRPTAYAVLTR